MLLTLCKRHTGSSTALCDRPESEEIVRTVNVGNSDYGDVLMVPCSHIQRCDRNTPRLCNVQQCYYASLEGGRWSSAAAANG